MFDSLLPEQSNSLDASLKSPFTNSSLNVETSNDILPPPRTKSGFSQAEIDLKNLTFSGDFIGNDNFLQPYVPLKFKSSEDLNSANYNSTTPPDTSSVDLLTGKILSNTTDSTLPASIVERSLLGG